MSRCDIAVVIPTFNRANDLQAVLTAVLDQDAGDVTYEVLVVDNNSTDETAAVVQRAVMADTTGVLRYAFERRRGVSHARNTGVAMTTAPVILFIDDDCVPGRDWVRTMKDAFDAHPDVHCIGGRLKAEWRVPPPTWMGPRLTGPIALQDRPSPTYVSAQSASVCLLTANLGIRRTAFEQVGGFSPDYPRGQDREMQMRMWRAGLQGLYLPAMDVTVPIPQERMTRRYHRRWYATTAKFHARMRFRDCVDANGVLHENPRGARLGGSPLFLYREWLTHLIGWVGNALTLRHDARFYHETRLWYGVGFFITRWRDRRPVRAAVDRRSGGVTKDRNSSIRALPAR